MARKTRTTTKTAKHERRAEGEEIVVSGVIGYIGFLYTGGTVHGVTAFVYVSPTGGFVEFLSDANIYVAIADEPETMRMLRALQKSDRARIAGRFDKGVIVVSSATLIQRGDGITMISNEEERALKAQR